jgi:hypothetical protein
MKNYILGLVTSLIFIAVFSFSTKTKTIKTESKAEEVPSVVKEYKSHQFYVEQAKLWKQELQLNKNDENAWFNLFKANRYAKMSYNNEHSPELDWQQNIEWVKEAAHLLSGEEIIKQMEATIPGTFMAYYLKYYNRGNLAKKDFGLLEKAYAINPEFYEIYDDFIAHYELTQDEDQRKEFNKKWFLSNDFSENLLNYHFNVLTSLKENSIVFSYGDNDFFAPIMLQDALGVREDVTVINLHMVLSEVEYRNSIFKKLNIKPFRKDFEYDFSEMNRKEMIDYIITNKPKELPLYFGLGCRESLKKDFEDKLYMIGLAYEYSEENIDNLAELKNNYENKYLLDYIQIQFSNDSYDTSTNVNYIPGIHLLHSHYKLSGDLTKMKEMKELAITIANTLEGKHTQEYKKYILHHFSK